MNEVLHTVNAMLAKGAGNDLIIVKWNAAFVDFAIAAFVDELTHGVERRVTISDIRLDKYICKIGLLTFKHTPLCSCFKRNNCNTLRGFGLSLMIPTTCVMNKSFWLWFNEEIGCCLRLSPGSDELPVKC